MSWIPWVIAGAGAVVAAIAGWIFGRKKSAPGIAIRTPEEIDRTTERILDHRKDSNEAVDNEVDGHISSRHDKFGGGQ